METKKLLDLRDDLIKLITSRLLDESQDVHIETAQRVVLEVTQKIVAEMIVDRLEERYRWSQRPWGKNLSLQEWLQADPPPIRLTGETAEETARAFPMQELARQVGNLVNKRHGFRGERIVVTASQYSSQGILVMFRL